MDGVMADDRIWVGRTVAGTLLWVFDPSFSHPDKAKVYGFSLNSGEMRAYEKSVVSSNLRELTGERKDAALAAYLRWKEAKGGLFAEEAALRERIEEGAEAKRSQLDAGLARERRILSLRDRMRLAQKSSAVAIKEAIEYRQIPFLIHFTRIENLGGIVEKGILPVSSLGDEGLRNDSKRLDGYPEAVSLSVSFPNYLMFYRYRCLNPGCNWAVVMVSTDVLTEIPSLFFPSNAANGKIRSLGDDELEALMGIDGFSAMFADSPTGWRHDRGLPERATTDPQAELLAFGTIPPSMIRGVRILRPDRDAAKVVGRLLSLSGLGVGGKLFEPRADWRYWQVGVKIDSGLTRMPDDIPF